MTENPFRFLMPSLFVSGCLLGLYLAVFNPHYFNNPSYLGKLIVLEILVLALWEYRTRYFSLLVLAFLWAGTDVPLQGDWTSGRWVVLGLGAIAGLVVYLKDRQHSFGLFHLAALASGATALISAMTSVHPKVALLKAGSLLLVFLYGATGARTAVLGREAKFCSGLLLACEILVYLSAIAYFILRKPIYGNPNSLGVIMGIGAAPVLVWGVLISEGTSLSRRRKFAFVVCFLLLLSSYSRASIVAALFSCGLLCLALRQYRLLAKGVGLVLLGCLIVAATVELPGGRVNRSNSVIDTFLFKGRPDKGLLGSRRSPWDQTSEVIREHPWFGSGFGTSITAPDEPDESIVSSEVASTTAVVREHGNSYMAIVEWVGLLGVVPFAVLLIIVVINVGRVILWMRRTGSAFSPAVPIAAILAAGVVGAGFEDWMFACGYYMCVFFWAMAFVVIDVIPIAEPALVASAPSYTSPQWSNLGVATPAG